MFIQNLDDFLKKDEKMNLLKPSISMRTVSFLARTFTQDSKLYAKQSEYWLEYLSTCAVHIAGDKGQEEARKSAALRACMLIDQGGKDTLEEAKDVLEGLVTEDYPLDDETMIDKESDNRILVYSLLGLIKKAMGKTQKEQIEGLKL